MERPSFLKKFCVVYSVLIILACGGGGGGHHTPSSKDITSFSIEINNVVYNGAIGTNTITVQVPYGTDLSSLSPAIAHTGESADPASGLAQDFTNSATNPIAYIITAQNNSTKTYTVTVTWAPNTACDITSFAISGSNGTIGPNNISVQVPYGTNLTALTPTIVVSAGATAAPASVVAQDFTNPVNYTVTAQDGVTTKTYTVTVTWAPNTACDITSFAISGSNGTIGPNTVSVQVPYGTDLTLLAPMIAVSPGATVIPTSGTLQDFTNPVNYMVTAQDGVTTKTYTVTVTWAPNTACDITSFAISGSNGTIGPNTVSVQVPYGTDLTLLAPMIAVSPGATVIPASGVAQDFTNPVNYVITAQDGVNTKTYQVTVTWAPNTAFDITSFSISGSNGTIGPNIVSVQVPYGTPLTALTPAITVSPGATVIPASGVAQDFTNPVNYTVTAQDGVNTKTYTVTVTVLPNTACDITSFVISGSNGTIGPNIVSVQVPYGTDLTALAPIIAVSPGATVIPASGVAQDFTNPVNYTVTAQDGVNTKTYTVTVTVLPNTACDITSFAISGSNGTIGPNTVSIQVPWGTDVTALTPIIAVSPGATVIPVSGAPNDFTTPQTYIVTAQDGSTTKEYTVTVTAASAPTPKYAYVVNSGNNTVSQYTIGVDGSLTPMATPTVGTGTLPISVTVHPSGQYAYVANAGSDTVSQYTIGVDGALTPMAMSTVGTGGRPYFVTVHPSGQYAYVANAGNVIGENDTISQYTIDATGALTPMAEATVAVGDGPRAVTIHPSGQYAYAANIFTDNISQYTIDATGALTPMATPTIAAEDEPRIVAFDPTGRYAYVSNYLSNNISQYTIDADGSLTPMAAPTVAAGNGPRFVTVHPSGYAYAPNLGESSVSQYTIGADGSLTPMATPTVGAEIQPCLVTVDPSGQYAYVVNYGSDNVSQYTIGATGALTPMATPAVGAGHEPLSIVTVGN